MENTRLFKAVEQWEHKLKECQYVGEIYLGAGELSECAREFTQHEFELRKRRKSYETALLVLAVNCAYHHYDDEGFWEHFSRLLGQELLSVDKDRIGRIIEGKLRLQGLLATERSGPFRYVGALLEQCGVSKRYISTLARVIKELKGGRSWNFMINMEFSRLYQHLEGTGYSSYLKHYLQDVEGWKFLRQVSTLLHLYEQGNIQINELKELSGYQPDFWDALLAEFQTTLIKTAVRASTLKPRIYFSLDDNCIIMKFPDEQYIAQVYRPKISEEWSYPITRLDRIELLSDLYMGKVPGVDGMDEEWAIPGWIPDGKPAIFDIRYGLLSKGSYLVPGEYFLLVPGHDVPAGETLAKLGNLNLVSKWVYEAYRVLLRQGDKVEGYRTDEMGDFDLSLQWETPGKFLLPYVETPADVFTGSLPSIKISNFEPIQSGRIGLFYQTSKRAGRIRSLEDLDKFRREASGDAPISGKIYLVSTGRTRSDGLFLSGHELEFCLLPEVRFEMSGDDHSFNSEPLVNLQSDGPVGITLKNCTPVSNLRTWKVPVQVSPANGNITCGSFSFQIKIPVHRVRLYNSLGRAVRYITPNESGKQGRFIITGPPGASASVTTVSGSKVKDIVFDHRGRCDIDSGSLLEITASGIYPVEQMIVSLETSTIRTGVIILDIERIKQKLITGSDGIYPQGIDGLIIDIIRLCKELCHFPTQRRNLQRMPNIHPDIDSWLNTLLACAQVFDSSEILVDGRIYNAIQHLQDKTLKRALTVISAQDEVLSNELDSIDISSIPDIGRWRTTVKKVIKKCSWEGTLGHLEDWSREIKSGYGIYRSYISSIPGGRVLTEAWERYYVGNYSAALGAINSLKSNSDMVCTLRDILYVFLLLRTARLQEACRKCIGVRHQSLTNALCTIGMLVEALNGLFIRNSNCEVITRESCRALPLRTEDYVLTETMYDLTHGKKLEVFNQDTDWLLLLLICMTSDDSSVTVKAAQVLRSRADIPPSPEKSIILDKLPRFKER